MLCSHTYWIFFIAQSIVGAENVSKKNSDTKLNLVNKIKLNIITIYNKKTTLKRIDGFIVFYYIYFNSLASFFLKWTKENNKKLY